MLAVTTLGLTQGCKQSSAPGEDSNRRGEPQLVCDTLIFDEESKTFSLTLRTDSTAGAEVTYFLIDCDSILMQSTDGKFRGIQPLDEGYNVQAKVVWEDTTIVTPLTHILGFVIPREPVEKLPIKEVQQLINKKDKGLVRGESKYFTQNYDVKVTDSKMPPTSMQEIYTFLKNDVWKSVIVTDVTYDDQNLITSVTLKPVGEQNIEADEDDEEIIDYY